MRKLLLSCLVLALACPSFAAPPLVAAEPGSGGSCPQFILDGFMWTREGSGYTREGCAGISYQGGLYQVCTTIEAAIYSNPFGFTDEYDCTNDQWL
jgi:hypothetical protein